MFSRIKRQAKTYYQGQADLAYVDSLFENLADSNAPIAFDHELWMTRAEKAQNTISAAAAEIVKMGGTIREGRIFNGQGELIKNHTVWAA